MRTSRLYLVLVACLLPALAACAPPASPPVSPTLSAAAGSDDAAPGPAGPIAGVRVFSGLSANHIAEGTPIEGSDRPPAGGDHYPRWQSCGIYDTPVSLGYAIHSLEHGTVWLSYRPDLAMEQVAELRELARGRSHVLMSPYPGQEIDLILTAWGLQLEIESLPDERAAHFIERYENGPQNPEPGAPCLGGVGTPLP